MMMLKYTLYLLLFTITPVQAMFGEPSIFNQKNLSWEKHLTIRSQLDYLIPPEIKDDGFYKAIYRISQKPEVLTILEIGSSSGQGSTEAFVEGIRRNPSHPILFCMEISKPRFAALQDCYKNERNVRCYNVSSVPLHLFPSEFDITTFYQTTETNLNFTPLNMVLGWLRQDIEYIKNSCVPERGIEIIKSENGIDTFDVVLIDGSEFTGIPELQLIYGAKYILLDDICTYKNYTNYNRLKADPAYVLVKEDFKCRNGYAVFKRFDQSSPF
jgi:hypothetical protein